MGEVFVDFVDPVRGPDGRQYIARACGTETKAGLWQGWLEFVPMDGSSVLRSRRETTQPNRQDTNYWATGLTLVYLEGALTRALKPLRRAKPRQRRHPAYDGPAPDIAPGIPARETILNPFSVYAKGEGLLRSQLAALSGRHLVNILRGHGLTEEDPAVLLLMPCRVLIELIVRGVRERLSPLTQ